MEILALEATTLPAQQLMCPLGVKPKVCARDPTLLVTRDGLARSWGLYENWEGAPG